MMILSEYLSSVKPSLMKIENLLPGKQNLQLFSITAFLFLLINPCSGQYPGINDDIAKLRKGELIIKARPGDKVIIEQQKHDFWFGCAITNGLAGSRMADEDKRQYKEKFLENFNSAVTENAVKWLDMEREKGQVNYTTVDGILQWTEENDIPLRGHNIFWGIPNRVQPWLKEMNDNELREALKNRAETLARHYKGQIGRASCRERV